MWDKRESNMMYQDQNMNFDSVGPDVPFMQNMRFPPPNNGSDRQFFAEASRKRKAMDTDLGSYVYDGVSARSLGNLGGNMGHSLQGEHTSQHNVVLPQAVDPQLKTPVMFFNHNSESAKPSNAESQYGNYQFFGIDNSLLRLETKEENIKKAAFGSLQSFHHNEPSFSVKTPVGEIPKLHDSQHIVYDIASQSEPSKFLSYYRQSNGCMEMPQAALRSNNGMNLGHGYNNLPRNPCLYPYSMSSKNLAIMDSSHLRMGNEKFHSDVGTFIQNFSKSGQAEVKACGLDTGLEEGRNTSIGTTNSTQTSAVSEGREAYEFCRYHSTEIRSENFISNDIFGAHLNVRDKEQSGSTIPPIPVLTESSCSEEAYLDYGMLKNSTQVSKDFETKIFEKDDGSNIENKSHPLGERTSPRSDNCLAGRPVEPGDGLSLNLEERSKSVPGKVSPMIIEKLWDGLFQLNTSTTVSAVAFFKSGEKAQDIKWSEHLEIKGKVRLQAFEKFIQELPRSRNRALMVISLCWKVGSSRAGLMGMKEVAKGYRESERVGFAQICSGFDLYVCPRSDTIITILAKYGFFKGMAAVEEDQDSLIGCIVWRRGHTSSNPVPKISERKVSPLPDQPLNSPEPSVPEMNCPKHGSESKQEKAPSPLISETKSTPLDSARPMMIESKVIQSTDDASHGVSSFPTNIVSDITLSMPYNFPLIPDQPPTAQKPESTCIQDTVKHAEIPITQTAGPKKLDMGVEPTQPILLGPPQMLRGVQQQTNTQFSNGSPNLRNYNSGPAPESRTSVSLDSPLIRAPLPTTQKPDSSFGQNPMQCDSKAELTQPALPAPPLPPEILQRIIQFSREACKAPTEGMSKADTSFMLSGEPKKPTESFEAQLRSTDLDDDDGDLPEFDFDSACGVPKAPVSEFPWSTHQTHFPDDAPFNKQLPVEGVKNAGGPTTPIVSMEVVQRPQALCFPGKSLNTYHGTTTLITKFGGLITEKKPADGQASHSLSQPCTVKADKYSSSCNIAPKSRWNDNDDDDDMPEWCPPDLDQLKPSTIAGLPSPILKPVSDNAAKQPLNPAPSPTSFRPPPQSRGLLHVYQPGLLGPRPATANPAPQVQTRPAIGFVRSDPRPHLVPHPNHSLRPPATNFSTRPPTSDVSWRRRRQH